MTTTKAHLFHLTLLTLAGVLLFCAPAYTYETDEERYQVSINGQAAAIFSTYREALYFSYPYEDVAIFDTLTDKWVYHNPLKFQLLSDSNASKANFYEFKSAMTAAKASTSKIRHLPTGQIIWTPHASETIVPFTINHILQFPELPRGCSVVSLAMLLDHAGISVDKMTLMSEIHQQNTPHHLIGDEVHFADPYYGFVGDVSTFSEPGLGVYYPAVLELLQSYLPTQALNLTGTPFEDLTYLLDSGVPLWVMVNAKYDTLPESDYLTWMVHDSPIQITKWMHAVLVIGHDDDFVYLADPLAKREKVDKQGFINAFDQMGRQALSYVRL